MRPKMKYVWFRAALVALMLAGASSCNSGGDGAGKNPIGPGNQRELDSGDISNGGVYNHRFATSGTYPYHCIYHSPMRGTVTVDASAADTVVTVNITSDTDRFPAASVKPGGRVVWTNNMGMTHTVTSD